MQMHLEPKAQGAGPLHEYAAAEGHSAGSKSNAMAKTSSEDCGLDLEPLGNFLLSRCACYLAYCNLQQHLQVHHILRGDMWHHMLCRWQLSPCSPEASPGVISEQPAVLTGGGKAWKRAMTVKHWHGSASGS